MSDGKERGVVSADSAPPLSVSVWLQERLHCSVLVCVPLYSSQILATWHAAFFFSMGSKEEELYLFWDFIPNEIILNVFLDNVCFNFVELYLFGEKISIYFL